MADRRPVSAARHRLRRLERTRTPTPSCARCRFLPRGPRLLRAHEGRGAASRRPRRRLGPVEAGARRWTSGAARPRAPRTSRRRLARLGRGADIAEGTLRAGAGREPRASSYRALRRPSGSTIDDGPAVATSPSRWASSITCRPAGWTGFLARARARDPPRRAGRCWWSRTCSTRSAASGPARCEFDQDATFLRAPRLRRLHGRRRPARRPGRATSSSSPSRSRRRRAIERRLRWLPIGAQYIVSGRVTSAP